LDDIFYFIKGYKDKSDFDRPFDYELCSEINDEDINYLIKKKYPEDFIYWHSKYGGYYFWIESMRINPTTTVIKNINDDYYSLFTKNNYLNKY